MQAHFVYDIERTSKRILHDHVGTSDGFPVLLRAVMVSSEETSAQIDVVGNSSRQNSEVVGGDFLHRILWLGHKYDDQQCAEGICRRSPGTMARNEHCWLHRSDFAVHKCAGSFHDEVVLFQLLKIASPYADMKCGVFCLTTFIKINKFVNTRFLKATGIE